MTRATQPLRAPPVPRKALKMSSEVDECKPLTHGTFACTALREAEGAHSRGEGGRYSDIPCDANSRRERRGAAAAGGRVAATEGVAVVRRG